MQSLKHLRDAMPDFGLASRYSGPPDFLVTRYSRSVHGGSGTAWSFWPHLEEVHVHTFEHAADDDPWDGCETEEYSLDDYEEEVLEELQSSKLIELLRSRINKTRELAG